MLRVAGVKRRFAGGHLLAGWSYFYDTLIQVVYCAPRRFWLIRCDTKAVRQEVLTRNPYSRISYRTEKTPEMNSVRDYLAGFASEAIPVKDMVCGCHPLGDPGREFLICHRVEAYSMRENLLYGRKVPDSMRENHPTAVEYVFPAGYCL